MTEQDLLAELIKACADAGGQAAFARKTGIPQPMISMAISRKRPIADAVANSMGYVRRTEFVKVLP